MLELLLQRACPALQGPDREALLRALQEGQWTQADRRLKAVPAAAGEDAVAWAELIDKTVRGVSRASKQWTTARRKDSLQRVLTGSRSDAERLQRRLSQLVASWDGEQAPEEEPPLVVLPDAQGDATGAGTVGAPVGEEVEPGAQAQEPPVAAVAAQAPGSAPAGVENVWPRVVATLGDTVRCALPVHEARAQALGEELSALQQRLLPEGQDAALADALDEACGRARRLLSHRHHLTDQLGVLTRELTAGLADLAEDDSWAQGQCAVMLQQLDEGLTARSVRSVNQLLSDTRERQQQLRTERGQARDALKQAIHRMLSEIGELGTHTGRFEESIGRYADVIGQADTVESLAGIVQEMVDETRTVHGLVASAQQRLQDEHGRAAVLSDRVQSLEEELRRISEEVATDPLTKIANRRGLMGAFESEVGRARRDAAPLSVGLLDIDNFKRLNDELGHNTGTLPWSSWPRRSSRRCAPAIPWRAGAARSSSCCCLPPSPRRPSRC